MRHKLSPAAKTLLIALGEELLHGVITNKEYDRRGHKLVVNDRKACRKKCCKVVAKPSGGRATVGKR